MQRLVIAVVTALALLAFSLVTAFGGVARADEPCKVDCEPIVILPDPNPSDGSIIGPVIVVPDIISIIGPQITFEAGLPNPSGPGINADVGNGPWVR